MALRRAHFRALSTHPSVFEEATVTGATLAIGLGTISVGGASLGFWPSPYALTGCIHLEARMPWSRIEIGAGTVVNNDCTFISEGPGIRIGRSVLIGPRVSIVDSDFHSLDASERTSALPATGAVHIGDHVFIGAAVTIAKGVTIGDGAVIGVGAVVTRDVPAGAIAAGNPARVLTPKDQATG